MIQRQVILFFAALMFYTRIPCPSWVDHRAEYINRSIRYFPLIGWIVGFIAAVVYLAGAYLFSSLTALILSLAASVLTTGAFHEDGFADTCDGFGGGWTADKILLIMKDSRVGTYGVVGLLLLFGFKISLLREIFTLTEQGIAFCLLLFISTHAMSRFMASTFIFTHQYVRDAPDSKAKPVAQHAFAIDLWVGALLAVLPLMAFAIYTQVYLLLLLPLPMYLTKMWLGSYFKKWIGGYTGDCLGATQQVTEVVCYLFFLLLWKFT